MSALDYCTREIVTIATTSGDVQVPAWRYGELAIHRPFSGAGKWTLTHLPSGFGMASANCRFDRVEDAAEAMLQVHALRNDWRSLCADDCPPLGPAIKRIGMTNNGFAVKPSLFLRLESAPAGVRHDLNEGPPA